MGNKISACLVVYNEEKCVERCLDSIKNVVDEIIVVHDGECKDKTLEICGKYTNNIFVREHVGVAEPHRPFSYEKASGDWILQVDADEFLSGELKGKIRSLTEDESIAAYEFLWPLWDGEKKITGKWPYKVCLARKNKMRFAGIPNFVFDVDGKKERVNLTLAHQPDYNNFSWSTFKKKWIKWARLQAGAYLTEFGKIEKYNYHANDWPLKIKLRIKFPLILMPLEFLITFYRNMSEGAYKEGLIGYKVAMMISVYRVMVNYYIYKNK